MYITYTRYIEYFVYDPFFSFSFSFFGKYSINRICTSPYLWLLAPKL